MRPIRIHVDESVGGAAGRLCATALVALTTAALLGACNNLDKLLGVESGSHIPTGQVETPAAAALLVTGAVSDFECAFGAYVLAGALIGEELEDATQTADRWPYDQRNVQATDNRYQSETCDEVGVYTPLQTARASADNVLRLMEREDWLAFDIPNRAGLYATAAAYAGYSYLLMGEGFCSAAFSSLDENHNPVYGGEVQRDSIFNLAVARFTAAIDSATSVGADADSIKNLALVGRARAYLNLGELALARADAELVPVGFVYYVAASAASLRRQNRIYEDVSDVGTSSSVGPRYRAPFDDPNAALIPHITNDPRVPVAQVLDEDGLPDSSTTGVPLFSQLKYTTADDPIRLASYDEAQLIIAEADIAGAGGSLSEAAGIINTFRARGNEGSTSSTTAEALMADLIEERRREFFLEGQHLGDLIRYAITPYPAVGTDFPGGGTYQSQLCMPLPNVERQNNPLIPG